MSLLFCNSQYIFPGVKLVQYAGAISRLVRTRQESDLVLALDRQRSFWKLVGIMMIVMIGLYVPFIIGMVLSGVFSHPVSRRSHEPREDQVDLGQSEKLPKVFHTDHDIEMLVAASPLAIPCR